MSVKAGQAHLPALSECGRVGVIAGPGLSRPSPKRVTAPVSSLSLHQMRITGRHDVTLMLGEVVQTSGLTSPVVCGKLGGVRGCTAIGVVDQDPHASGQFLALEVAELHPPEVWKEGRYDPFLAVQDHPGTL
jgi:hypothetical protein